MYPGLYPLPLPWIHPAYAMGARGSQVPLMPIPRLKTKQPASAAAEPPAKKSRKTKKVASFSLRWIAVPDDALWVFGSCGKSDVWSS
eukprot:UN04748